MIEGFFIERFRIAARPALSFLHGLYDLGTERVVIEAGNIGRGVEQNIAVGADQGHTRAGNDDIRMTLKDGLGISIAIGLRIEHIRKAFAFYFEVACGLAIKDKIEHKREKHRACNRQ